MQSTGHHGISHFAPTKLSWVLLHLSSCWILTDSGETFHIIRNYTDQMDPKGHSAKFVHSSMCHIQYLSCDSHKILDDVFHFSVKPSKIALLEPNGDQNRQGFSYWWLSRSTMLFLMGNPNYLNNILTNCVVFRLVMAKRTEQRENLEGGWHRW